MKFKILAVAAGFVIVPALAGAQDSTATTTTTTTTTRTSTSTGTDCPRGCPTSKGAAGLSGVQFLALQQELRDRGCGNESVTGRLDAATRRALRTCAQRLGVANTGPAVLVAMNIGYSETDITPAG